ncbi:hypothetical protein COCOBI_13-1190 [Coccomyxa sp. Obi]|nr:hypothetical protein COCOBI_13-1190 [Coccomyxa sp. Obi]
MHDTPYENEEEPSNNEHSTAAAAEDPAEIGQAAGQTTSNMCKIGTAVEGMSAGIYHDSPRLNPEMSQATEVDKHKRGRALAAIAQSIKDKLSSRGITVGAPLKRRDLSNGHRFIDEKFASTESADGPVTLVYEGSIAQYQSISKRNFQGARRLEMAAQDQSKVFPAIAKTWVHLNVSMGFDIAMTRSYGFLPTLTRVKTVYKEDKVFQQMLADIVALKESLKDPDTVMEMGEESLYVRAKFVTHVTSEIDFKTLLGGGTELLDYMGPNLEPSMQYRMDFLQALADYIDTPAFQEQLEKMKPYAEAKEAFRKGRKAEEKILEAAEARVKEAEDQVAIARKAANQDLAAAKASHVDAILYQNQLMRALLEIKTKAGKELARKDFMWEADLVGMPRLSWVVWMSYMQILGNDRTSDHS